MLSENIVACLLPGTSFGGCLVSRSRFSAEILPGFFAECRKLFVLAGFSSVFVSNGASWKIMLLFIGINSAITSCFSRISLSHLTTEDEIKAFLQAFDVCYRELTAVH